MQHSIGMLGKGLGFALALGTLIAIGAGTSQATTVSILDGQVAAAENVTNCGYSWLGNVWNLTLQDCSAEAQAHAANVSQNVGCTASEAGRLGGYEAVWHAASCHVGNDTVAFRWASFLEVACLTSTGPAVGDHALACWDLRDV